MDTQERRFVADRRVRDTLDDLRRQELVRAARARRNGRYMDAQGNGVGALIDRLASFLAGGAASAGRPAAGSLA
jgi:hypothetical protein